MSISIYDQFVPVFSHMLSNLDKMLSKAEADADARKIELDVFVNGRLAPDMLPLTRQIQIMTDRRRAARAGSRAKSRRSGPDDEKTFADLHARDREDARALEDLQARELRGRRDALDRAQVPERDVQLHGQGLLA